MEAIRLENIPSSESSLIVVQNNTRKPFIEANTAEASLQEIKQHHVIPVFHRDNEPLIPMHSSLSLLRKLFMNISSQKGF
jgi:hypothetical protein